MNVNYIICRVSGGTQPNLQARLTAGGIILSAFGPAPFATQASTWEAGTKLSCNAVAFDVGKAWAAAGIVVYGY